MKRCPTCDKTYDDSLRFCHTDGTPLVEDVPVDPYKTIVARPEDIAAAIPGGSQAREEDEVLQIPEEEDLKKTVAISEEELRQEMAEPGSIDEQVIDIPPLGSSPEPPRTPDLSPPPSPFSTPEPDEFQHTRPPIPSPFGEKDTPSYEPPPTPDFRPYPEPSAPVEEPAAFNPFGQPQQTPSAMEPAAWTPPPAPDAAWQNKEIGQNTPFQPPPAGASLNQTLPIVSLVLGIISLCCYISPITGLAALITGYLGKKNADTNPQVYGGRGLALAGMILGGIFFLIGVGYYVFVILVYAGVLGSALLQGF